MRTFVRSPPPAACNVAIQELRKARIKKWDSTHIILVPRLMTPMWLKQLYNDVIWLLKSRHLVTTGTLTYKPCVIGFCFPFLSHFPWQIRSNPKMFSLHRTLQQVWEEDQVSSGFVLHKFMLASRRFPHMQENVVRNMLYFTSGSEVPQTSRSEDSQDRPGNKCKMEEQETRWGGVWDH